MTVSYEYICMFSIGIINYESPLPHAILSICICTMWTCTMYIIQSTYEDVFHKYYPCIGCLLIEYHNKRYQPNDKSINGFDEETRRSRVELAAWHIRLIHNIGVYHSYAYAERRNENEIKWQNVEIPESITQYPSSCITHYAHWSKERLNIKCAFLFLVSNFEGIFMNYNIDMKTENP